MGHPLPEEEPGGGPLGGGVRGHPPHGGDAGPRLRHGGPAGGPGGARRRRAAVRRAVRGRPGRQRRHVAGGPRDLRPQRVPGRTQPHLGGLQAEAGRTHRRRPQHGARLHRLHGHQRHHRPHALLDHGPGALRGGHRFRQSAAGQHDRRPRRAVLRHGRRAHPLRAGLLLLSPAQRRQTGLAAGQPRQPVYGGRVGRRRIPGLHRAPVRPHAAARRAAGGLPQRRRLRGAAGERLGAPLVAGRGLRSGDADHDQQRPPHRPANDDVPGGRDVLVRGTPQAQRLRPHRLRRQGPGGLRLGDLRDGVPAGGRGRRGTVGRGGLPGAAALRHRHGAQGRRVLRRRDEPGPQPPAGHQPASGRAWQPSVSTRAPAGCGCRWRS